MKIFCKNYECNNIILLEKPINFSYRKNYTPISKNDTLCNGKCSKDFCGFIPIKVETQKTTYNNLPVCTESPKNLNHSFDICFCECVWNNNYVCEREEIFVDIFSLDGRSYYICKCQSDKKFEGHRDWSSLLQPNGTAKGGLIDDAYAKKMHADSKKFKVGSHLLKFGKE